MAVTVPSEIDLKWKAISLLLDMRARDTLSALFAFVLLPFERRSSIENV